MIQHCTVECVQGSKDVPEKTVNGGLLVSCEDVLELSHAAFITCGGTTEKVLHSHCVLFTLCFCRIFRYKLLSICIFLH